MLVLNTLLDNILCGPVHVGKHLMTDQRFLLEVAKPRNLKFSYLHYKHEILLF